MWTQTTCRPRPISNGMKKFKEKMMGVFFRPKQAARLRGVVKNKGIKPEKQEPKE